MSCFKRSAAAAAVLVCVFLSACGTGRTLVMEPPAERKSYASATLERSADSVTVPEELRVMFRDQLRKELYGTSEQEISSYAVENFADPQRAAAIKTK